MVEIAPLAMTEYDGTTWATQFGITPVKAAVEQEWASERETARTQELEVVSCH